MTCKITVTNESDKNSFDNHVLEVIGGAGDKHTVGPGMSVTTHVWVGAPVQITELDFRGEKRGGPDGYGALPPAMRNL